MQEICTICKETITEQTWLNCKHSFCYNCIWEWCKQTNTCPLCRSSVTGLETVVGYCPIGPPKVPYAEAVNEYLARRDFHEGTGENLLRQWRHENLAGFVVSDSESELSQFDDDDVHINVTLEPNDYQPISSRTRARSFKP